MAKQEIDIKTEAESIHSKLLDVLGDFGRLTDKGCEGHCHDCPLHKLVLHHDDSYFYASSKLKGDLTICDFLGILGLLWWRW